MPPGRDSFRRNRVAPLSSYFTTLAQLDSGMRMLLLGKSCLLGLRMDSLFLQTPRFQFVANLACNPTLAECSPLPPVRNRHLPPAVLTSCSVSSRRVCHSESPRLLRGEGSAFFMIGFGSGRL